MFAVSKVFWLIADPGNLLLAALVLGAVLGWTRWRRAGRRLVAAVAAVALAIAVLPVDDWLTMPLENRFPPPASLPAEITGIIVLGGSIQPTITHWRGQPSLNGHAERLTEFVALARRYPDAKLIFTGGSGSLGFPDLKETVGARELLARLGLPAERIIFEAESRNTHENAVYSRAIAAPRPDQRWILITSAFHMPRSVGCFRAVGWHVIPFPVDYMTTGRVSLVPSVNLIGGLGGVQLALHEWIGMIAYRILGHTDAAFPGPPA